MPAPGALLRRHDPLRARADGRSRPGRPSLLLQAMEGPRAYLEYAALVGAAPLLQLAPRGDGSPVILLPGFTGTDSNTLALRTVLRSLGHHAVGWGLGKNLGPTTHVISGIDRLVATLADKHGTTVSLVGWSLGGVFARRFAALRPHEVRRIVTLGSPYRLDDNRRSRAQWMYRRYEHLHDASDAIALGGPAAHPLAVPTTSIYSRTDGIVPWDTCVEPETDLAENVAVPSSHNGLGHHPLAIYVVADRLALPPGDSTRFRPPLAVRPLYDCQG